MAAAVQASRAPEDRYPTDQSADSTTSSETARKASIQWEEATPRQAPEWRWCLAPGLKQQADSKEEHRKAAAITALLNQHLKAKNPNGSYTITPELRAAIRKIEQGI